MNNQTVYIGWLIFLISAMSCLAQSAQDRGEVLIEENLEYSKYIKPNGDQEMLLLDVYQPKVNDRKKRPVIVFVHGGGFAHGDKQQELYKKMATTFAREGYVALSVNYTLMAKKEKFHPNVLIRDVGQVLKAVRWLETYKKKYKVDMSKVLICGDSAGGGIVVNASLNCQEAFRFAGCIDLWGGMPGEKRWSGPIFSYKLSDCTPPVCIIHGTDDSVVPYKTSIDLARQFKAANKYYELHPLKEVGHYPEELSDVFIPIMLSFSQKIFSKKIITKE